MGLVNMKKIPFILLANWGQSIGIHYFFFLFFKVIFWSIRERMNLIDTINDNENKGSLVDDLKLVLKSLSN